MNTDLDYNQKIGFLECAIDNSIKSILENKSDIHLALSGGVDSSLILVKFLKYADSRIPIVVHTIGSRKDHPDVEYSERLVTSLKKNYPNLSHNLEIMNISKDDLKNSNEILKITQHFPSNYYMLMKAISLKTNKIVCGDCIDELMGGYYSHTDPKKFKTRKEAFEYFMSRLIPDHLSILDKISTNFNIEVILPYGSKEVMESANIFNTGELINHKNRKKPIYDLARKNDLPKAILNRRKYGLVSALD